MEILDGTIVVTAIPQMSRSLDAPTSSTALVITAYLLTLAVLIPLRGWLPPTRAGLGCSSSTCRWARSPSRWPGG
jgi:MFS family permease